MTVGLFSKVLSGLSVKGNSKIFVIQENNSPFNSELIIINTDYKTFVINHFFNWSIIVYISKKESFFY